MHDLGIFTCVVTHTTGIVLTSITETFEILHSEMYIHIIYIYLRN